MDWSVVRQLRADVSEVLTQQLPMTRLSREQHYDLVLGYVQDAMRDLGATSAITGKTPLTAANRGPYIQAVMDALFGAGRFQRLLEEPLVENIEVEGYDSTAITYANGSVRYLEQPLFTSDEELVEELTHLARTAISGEKDFSPASPSLRMRLPDGSRLAADAWVCHRPSATFRVHRYVDTDLDEIRALGTVDQALAQFLAAAERAGRSIVVAGDPASGKTTLSRAILNCLPPDVRIATIETMYELGLHDMPHRHKRVWAAEAQPGGEPGPDGRPRGRITLSDLVDRALQKNVQRIVVGEITGVHEVVAMIEAMQAGKGCLSTIHADNATETLDRLATLIMGARANTSYEYAARLVAQNVDVIVHLALRQDPIRKVNERYVDEVVTLAPSGEPGVPAEITHVFAPGPDGRARPTGEIPPWADQLTGHGYDLNWLTRRVDTWGQQ